MRFLRTTEWYSIKFGTTDSTRNAVEEFMFFPYGYAVAQLVQVRRYKPGVSVFDSRWDFSLIRLFQPHYGRLRL